MQYLFPVLFVFAINVAANAEPPHKASPDKSSEKPTITDPAAESMLLGKLYTIKGINRLTPMSKVKIESDINADWASKNGLSKLDQAAFEKLLISGQPLAPNDKLIDGWHYAPWYRGSFMADDRKWQASLFLGGLGVITDDANRQGVFRFEMPKAEK
jgi:hypothetical protein